MLTAEFKVESENLFYTIIIKDIILNNVNFPDIDSLSL